MSVVPQPTIGRLLGAWTPDAGLVAALAVAALLYLLAVRRRRRGWPVWRTCSFMVGLLALAVALMSGVDSYAEQLLSVHMAQHLLLSLVSPALLLSAAPIRLALGSSPARVRAGLAAALSSRTLRTLSNPAVGFALFATTMLATHLTGLFELALKDQTAHAFEHAAYFWSGVLLLAPLIAADPLAHPPAPLARFCWLMGAMTVMSVPGALLTFATGVRYPSYLAAARALGRSALADEHLAGVIMWVGGGLAMFALALAVAMSAMLAEERRQERRELHGGPVETIEKRPRAVGA
ncbi:MAG TPA: cytochrome c oxidase assembly protein [Solirubrobacteraceae bacterium]|nr:cytochrome c oxidase assembly protein [Solirubrobacteraceae bacterium]